MEKEYITKTFTMSIDGSELDLYPKPEWGNDKKYGITCYGNGVIMRGKNWRTSIIEHEYPSGSLGYLVTTLQTIKSDNPIPDIIGHPIVHFSRVRGNLYKFQRLIRKDSKEMSTYGLHTFLEHKTESLFGTWTHNGKTEEE